MMMTMTTMNTMRISKVQDSNNTTHFAAYLSATSPHPASSRTPPEAGTSRLSTQPHTQPLPPILLRTPPCVCVVPILIAMIMVKRGGKTIAGSMSLASDNMHASHQK